MNYRHIYHAGNFADVIKHAALALMIDHLKRKDSAFAVIDTHAGIGRYDLTSVEANKTGEYLAGISRVLEAGPDTPELAPYLEVVRTLNPGGLAVYPGSPLLARRLLRPQDRLALVELHPEDVQTLRAEFRHDPQVGVHHRDAYEALRALLPPKERRGLVLIDPPFEVRDELARVVRGLKDAFKRWPTGIYGIWYPIKAAEPVRRFQAELTQAVLPKSTLAAELLLHTDDDPNRLNGCGLMILNPPWQLDEALARLLPEVLRRLKPEGGGAVRVEN